MKIYAPLFFRFGLFSRFQKLYPRNRKPKTVNREL
jgi:hypothetical protein